MAALAVVASGVVHLDPTGSRAETYFPPPGQRRPMQRRRLRFVHAQVGWMSAALVVLAALDALRYDLYFTTSLVGFLLVLVATTPVAVAPRWRTRLRRLAAAGLAVFATVVAWRTLAHLPPGVVP